MSRGYSSEDCQSAARMTLNCRKIIKKKKKRGGGRRKTKKNWAEKETRGTRLGCG